ncbi:MAG: membrane integrity-associated transporter subunit PqiC [Deltaproteobacteria bacterium]|nr:membrane integrity-associated transporter subunit PqiC [Deltaproteobacteria bacterium]
MRFFPRRLAVVTLGACLILVGGCASTQPTRFYVLTSLPDSVKEEEAGRAKWGVAIGVGPVDLPRYLDRPQIVTRTSRNELDLAEFDQWAEPLKDNFSNVLAENLSILIPTDRIAVFPWNRSTPIDYRVAVEVTRFEAKTGGNALLVARWSILGKDGKKVLMTRKSSFSKPVKTRGYKTRVSAMNQALEALSREIAKAIKAISK